MRWITGTAVAVVLAGCGTARALPPLSSTAAATTGPTSAATPGPTAASTVPPGRTVGPVLVITISGTGPASSITLDVDNRRSRRLGPVALPYVFIDNRLNDIDGAYPVTAEAQDGSGSSDARMTCRIVESGAEVARDAVKGPHSVASCSDHQPEDPLHPAVRSSFAHHP